MKLPSPLTVSASAALLSVLVLSGCSDALSSTEYHNEVVTHMNTTSTAIEETTLAYDNDIPNIVTESSEIDTTGLQSAYDEALATVTNAEAVLALESRDTEQLEAVRAEFEVYLETANTYVATYGEMVAYYADGTFKEELNRVADYNTRIHEEYNDYIESYNTLVDVVKEYED